MGANAALVAAAISVLVTVGHADRQFARRTNDAQAVSALLNRLREDVHAANDLRWNVEDAKLELWFDAGDGIVYRGDANRWERRTTWRNKLTSAFRLPADMAVAIEPAEAVAGELIYVTLCKTPEEPLTDRQPSLIAEMVVCVGRDEWLLQK